MSKSIKISPQHGLNPSMLICPYCRQPYGIALLGRLPQDQEAPREVVGSYEPCDDCKARFAGNVLVLEVVESNTFKDQQPIFEDRRVKLYPTFRFIVLAKEFAMNTFNLKDDQETMLMAHADFERLYNDISQYLEQPEEG